MELRHLRYFAAVGDALSFTKAAEKLHLAQPSLTRQVKDLEEEISVRLLNRTKRQVSLTEEGKSFLADAKRLLVHSSEIVESVQRLSRHEVPALNIGYVANLFPAPLPATLASFQRKFPTVSVNLFDMSYGDQFRALQHNKIDLGFVGSREPVQERGLQFRTIASEKTVVAFAKGNPLAKKTVVKLKDLKSMFFIGMSEESCPGYRNWLTATCQQAGFTPKVLQDADIERTVFQAVAAGLGVALLPAQVDTLPHEHVLLRPVSPPVLTEFCIAWRTDNPSTALKAYVQTIADSASSMR
jgi:DNA-binding transcriptional LysR family regulator